MIWGARFGFYGLVRFRSVMGESRLSKGPFKCFRGFGFRVWDSGLGLDVCGLARASHLGFSYEVAADRFWRGPLSAFRG